VKDDPENSSIISPLQIDAVKVPGTGGLIGMTACPGKDEYAGLGIPPGPFRRDLDIDLQAIHEWGAHAVVSLIERHEFELLGVQELPVKVHSLGIIWFHLPIVDLDIPDWRFEEEWNKVGKRLTRIITDGGRIIIHCRAGLGRTGTVAARLLVDFGIKPREAIARVRQSRPGAIQTLEQERYVLTLTI